MHSDITMKKNIIPFLFCTLFLGAAFTANAQAPYKHSIGVTMGTTQAVSYKTFVGNHFAVQLDLGTKYSIFYIAGYHNPPCWSMELAPNILYEGHFVKGLYGFVGGGVSLGFSFAPQVSYYNSTSPDMQIRDVMGKAGANGIFGLEYKFGIPLILQLDLRPGYRFQFNNEITVNHTIDWGLNFGMRYTF